MQKVPFYSDEDIIGALRGSTRAFEAALPDVLTPAQEDARVVWEAAMDAVAMVLGVEWRERDDRPTA